MQFEPCTTYPLTPAQRHSPRPWHMHTSQRKPPTPRTFKLGNAPLARPNESHTIAHAPTQPTYAVRPPHISPPVRTPRQTTSFHLPRLSWPLAVVDPSKPNRHTALCARGGNRQLAEKRNMEFVAMATLHTNEIQRLSLRRSVTNTHRAHFWDELSPSKLADNPCG